MLHFFQTAHCKSSWSWNWNSNMVDSELCLSLWNGHRPNINLQIRRQTIIKRHYVYRYTVTLQRTGVLCAGSKYASVGGVRGAELSHDSGPILAGQRRKGLKSYLQSFNACVETLWLLFHFLTLTHRTLYCKRKVNNSLPKPFPNSISSP